MAVQLSGSGLALGMLEQPQGWGAACPAAVPALWMTQVMLAGGSTQCSMCPGSAEPALIAPHVICPRSSLAPSKPGLWLPEVWVSALSRPSGSPLEFYFFPRWALAGHGRDRPVRHMVHGKPVSLLQAAETGTRRCILCGRSSCPQAPGCLTCSCLSLGLYSLRLGCVPSISTSTEALNHDPISSARASDPQDGAAAYGSPGSSGISMDEHVLFPRVRSWAGPSHRLSDPCGQASIWTRLRI